MGSTSKNIEIVVLHWLWISENADWAARSEFKLRNVVNVELRSEYCGILALAFDLDLWIESEG